MLEVDLEKYRTQFVIGIDPGANTAIYVLDNVGNGSFFYNMLKALPGLKGYKSWYYRIQHLVKGVEYYLKAYLPSTLVVIEAFTPRPFGRAMGSFVSRMYAAQISSAIYGALIPKFNVVCLEAKYWKPVWETYHEEELGSNVHKRDAYCLARIGQKALAYLKRQA